MSINWRTSGDMSLEDFRSSLPATSQIIKRDEVETVYTAAKPYTRLMRGMLEAESSGATNFKTVPATMNNPLNMRVRGKEPFQSFVSITQSIIEWKDRLTSATYAYGDTQTVAELVHVYAPAKDNNNEAQYVATVEAMINRYPKVGTNPDVPVDPGNGGTEPVNTPTIPDGWKLYDVAGLDTKIALPVPLIIDLIPTSQTNQRPGIKRRTPGYWVQHETANYAAGADAAMHNRYLHNGAEGQQTSFHFTVDDGVIYQMIPIDEVTWQSADGAGDGNMSGVSSELCVNRGINTAKARNNAEALAGGVLGALGLGSDRTKRHWDFNFNNLPSQRHHCPDEIMNDGYWPTFVENVGKIIAGRVVTSEYAVPLTYPWLTDDGEFPKTEKIGNTQVYYLDQVYEVVEEAERWQATGKNDNRVGPNIPVGTKFRAKRVYRAKTKAGKPVTVVVTPAGTRVYANRLHPYVTLTQRGNLNIKPNPKYKGKKP